MHGSIRNMSTLPFPVQTVSASPVAKPLVPVEGLHVLHLFYTVDQALWRSLGADEQNAAKENFTRLVRTIRSHPRTQLLVFSVVTLQGRPRLHDADARPA